MRVLVHGLAIAGTSVVRALLRRGHEVVVTDDAITDSTRSRAADLGVEVTGLAEDPRLLLAQVDAIVPAPAVPETHRLFTAAAAAGIPVWSEIELAYRWEQERPGGPRPILAITGTDGKTTTTDLATSMVRAAGLRTESLGNTDVPLIDAVDGDLDVLVVECTSFRLATTERFRADAAVWLNLAPDHLNWHVDMASYIDAKTKIFDHQRPDDVAIGWVDDPVVMGRLGAAPARRRTFGRAGADYRLDGTTLTGPAGPIADIADMWRALPHDITNALAAAALVLETGLAGPADISRALATFRPPPHRLEPVGSAGGITWYNDSKATTPHAASAAVRAFESLVLIAGGSRKGVDLSPMAAEPRRVRAVVALGETAPELHAIFDATTPVHDAADMADAVRIAAGLAHPGDAVVLSPGCASFDRYEGYPQRGEDFRACVAAHLAGTTGGPMP